MIALHRSAIVLPGRLSNAVAFAKQVAAYIKDTAGIGVSVSMPVGGNPSRIGWAAHYDNLGTLEAVMGKLMADPKYMEMIAKGGENFIAGSMHDEIWREI
jgi:hypothetical protein